MPSAREKTRATTLQQKFGFQDHELSTPRHDEIMLWLDANVEAYVLSELKDQVQKHEHDWRVDADKFRNELERLLCSRGLELQHHDWDRERQTIQIRRLEELCLPKHGLCPGPIITKTWEQPITTDRDFMVGFVDMNVHACFPFINADISRTFLGDSPTWLVGYPECWSFSFMFEVKPSIRSLGEVIRQVRMYQEYNGRARFVVVCPDDRFRNALESQKIGFLKCP